MKGATPMIGENGRVLLDRVTDRSWRYKPIVDVVAEPPEYVPAMYGLDHAVCQALAADWSPDEIKREVSQLLQSRTVLP
jgi:hypothetical protein